jgi:hypothetical protein
MAALDVGRARRTVPKRRNGVENLPYEVRENGGVYLPE